MLPGLSWVSPAALLTASFVCDLAPSVAEVDIVPTSVTLGEPLVPTTFVLQARLWSGTPANRWAIKEAPAYNLNWTISGAPWLELVSESDFRATFKVKATPSGPPNAKVKVEVGGKWAEAAILFPPSPAATQDEHKAAYAPDRPPDVSLVSGERGPTIGSMGCVTFSAFVRQALLGEMTKPCGTDASGWAVALAVDHQAVMTPVVWSAPAPPPDIPDAAPVQQAMLSLPVALHVMAWEDGNSTELDALRDTLLQNAMKDLQVANSNLAASRAGIQLTQVLTDAQAKIPTTQTTIIRNCRSGDDQTTTKDVAALLNVYYVDEMPGDTKAVTCTWTEGREWEVIYVERVSRAGSNLGHEIGHALGLVLPGDGHTNALRGFDRTNMMAESDDDGDQVGRSRFTVGQVFRMNADSGSWLAWAKMPPSLTTPIRPVAPPPLGCQCAPEPPSGPCPVVLADVAQGSATLPTIKEWRDCYDLLELTEVPETEEPVAIVGGRRWRAPPKTCSADVLGTREWRNNSTYMKFANLTRPGTTCPPWAAVFFRKHGLVYLKLEEPNFVFTQKADWGYSALPMPARTVVTVRAYFDEKDRSTVLQDTVHAVKTLEELNRTGLDLVFDLQPSMSPPSCPPAPPAGSYYLCYLKHGPQEATVHTKGIIVTLDKRNRTTVSHYLGRLFGLDVVNQAVLQAAGGRAGRYEENIMRAAYADRGQRLTLGQIFRMHTRLGTGLPDCANAPDRCPPLYAGED